MDKLYISLYTDEDLTSRLAITLRERGYEAESWYEAGMGGRTDAEHLAYAAHKGYALMTANKKHFPGIHREWLETGRHHSGIIIVSQRLKMQERFGELLRRTLALLDAKTADEARDQIFYLSNFG